MPLPQPKNMIHLGEGPAGHHHLPLDVATESIAIVARKGAGKTHTARVLVEDLVENHVQTLIIDPLDVWWGLRSSADGKAPGLDVVIFGGSHADLPLTEASGKALADLVVDRRINAVLVLDALTQGAQYRFMAEFGTRLYERKSEQQHRVPLHVVVDEADSFVGQKPFPEAMRCLGAWDRIVRRGRSRGRGTTLITQRPAEISKSVLTQTEILISLQVTGPQDRKALQEWINANATKEQAAQYLGSLASMQRGEAWVWSPAKLKCFFQVQIRQTRTFDSSFTPAVGKSRPTVQLKDLDLTAIKDAMAATIEEAKANDPKALKEQIRTLTGHIKTLELRCHQAPKTTGMTMDECKTMIDRAVEKATKQRDNQWRTKWDEQQRAIKNAFKGYPDQDGDMESPTATLPGHEILRRVVQDDARRHHEAHRRRAAQAHRQRLPDDRPPAQDPDRAGAVQRAPQQRCDAERARRHPRRLLLQRRLPQLPQRPTRPRLDHDR